LTYPILQFVVSIAGKRKGEIMIKIPKDSLKRNIIEHINKMKALYYIHNIHIQLAK